MTRRSQESKSSSTLTQQGGRFNLMVLDVNTGKAVRVPLEVPGRGPHGEHRAICRSRR